LKPANIMIEPHGGVRILDFGVAKASGPIKQAHTHEGSFIGTPGYMSPEAASGFTVDGRTDVFALAVVLFEMLTGELPFASPKRIPDLLGFLSARAPAIAERRSPDLEPAPDAVEALVSRGLAKDPAERPAMAQFRAMAIEALR